MSSKRETSKGVVRKTRSLKDDTRSVDEEVGQRRDRKFRPKSFHGNENAMGEDERFIQDLLLQLPSRQLATQARFITGTDTINLRTLRHRMGLEGLMTDGHASPDNIDDMAATMIFQDEDLDHLPDNLKVTEIRERFASASLTRKKNIKQHLETKLQEEGGKKKKVHRRKYNTCCLSCSLSWHRFKRWVANLRYTLALWHSHFKVIEGKFGTGVASYFYFIRFLLLLNLPSFLLLLAFVVIPQMLMTYVGDDDSMRERPGYRAQDFFVGTGWFEKTELYYGHYDNDDISIVSGLTYNMTLAYLLTMGGFYLLVLIITMVSLSKSYQKNYIESTDTVHLYYVNKVFCGWDYSVSSADTARLTHKSIFKEIQEYLASSKRRTSARTLTEWGKVLTIRLLCNLVVAGLLAGSGYLVWYLATTQVVEGVSTSSLRYLALPLAVSALNFILPFVFSVITSAERYTHPQTELVINMIRTILLILTTLGVLVAFLFTTLDCSQLSDDSRFIDSNIPCQECWETYMGQQLYRLVIIDFFFVLGITFISEFLRSLLARFAMKSLHKPEFNIAQNTLSLIYSQLLIWLGTFYSPLLSLIMIIKLVILFYIKRVSVTINCVSPVKPWRGGRTNTIILTLMFLAFLLSIFSTAYSIVFLTPSAACGPYQGRDTMYAVISDEIKDWQDGSETVSNVLSITVEIVTSFFFIVALFVTLIVVAHWSRVVSHGHQDMVDLLRHQIALEGKDKKFLLSLLLYTKEHRSQKNN